MTREEAIAALRALLSREVNSPIDDNDNNLAIKIISQSSTDWGAPFGYQAASNVLSNLDKAGLKIVRAR